MLWIVFWLIFGAGKPDESALISDVEKQYIVHCLSENSIIETRRKVGGNWLPIRVVKDQVKSGILTLKIVVNIVMCYRHSNWALPGLPSSSQRLSGR